MNHSTLILILWLPSIASISLLIYLFYKLKKLANASISLPEDFEYKSISGESLDRDILRYFPFYSIFRKLKIQKQITDRLIENLEIESMKTKKSMEEKSEEVEKLQKKFNGLKEMMEIVINSKSADELFEKMSELFNSKFGITSYIVYVYDKSSEFLNLYKIYGRVNASPDLVEILNRNKISIHDSKSIQRNCIVTKKSFLARNVRIPHLCKPEEENIIKGGIRAFFIVPLISDDEAFGSITFSDNVFQKSEIKNLTKSDRVEIENFMSLISPHIYQSLQKNMIEKAYSEMQNTKSELESRKLQMDRLLEMSREIQKKTNFKDMLGVLENIIWDSYHIGDYLLLVKNSETNEFTVSYVSQNWIQMSLDKKLKNIPFGDDKSFHKLVFVKGRSLFLPKLRNISAGEAEDHNRELLGMESFFAIPCIVNNEPFAVLSFADVRSEFAKDPTKKGVKGLTQKQREEIEQVVSLIANPLYQSIQKQKIEKAYSELQSTKLELESKKLQMERIQAMSSEIQKKTDFTDMLQTLENMVWESYHIADYILVIHNEESLEYQPLNVCKHWIKFSLNNKLKNVSIYEERSIYKTVFQKRELYFYPD